MISTEELIVTSGLDLASTTATEAARQQRDELLTKARQGVVISNPATAQGAASLLIELKTFTRSIDASRKVAKAPVLEIGRKIDALADELTKSLDQEAERISRMLGTYQQEQKRLEEEERRKAWEKEQAIIREANRVADEARRKLAAEQEALRQKEERARSDAGRERAQAEHAAATARAQADFDAHQKKVEAEIIAARVASSALATPKPEGIATQDEICFEVEDIVALYEANPAFVVMTPQKTAIKNALKTLRSGQSLPGVKHWRQAKTIVRSS